MSRTWPIQMLWTADRLSKLERLSVASFLAHGHQVHIYSYGGLDGVPEGAEVRNANEILPWNAAFLTSKAGVSGFSNLFRYTLLANRGGWWCDIDLIALRPFPTPKNVVFASECKQFNPRRPAGGAMFSLPNDPAIQALVEWAAGKDAASLYWCETGAALLERAIDRFRLSDRVLDHRAVCPLLFEDWQDTFLPGRAPEFGPESFAVHFWHEMWRRNGLDKNEDYGPNSLFEILKRRYGVL